MSSSPETEANQTLTAGQLLRQARLKAGVHLAVLSIHLKVPVKQLEALEADDLDPSKGPVFYRSLTASVCRHLGIDPAPILKLLPRLSGQLEPVKRLQLPAGSDSASFNRHASYRQNFPSGLLWLAALFLGLTAFFIWMPSAASWAEQHLHSFSFFGQSATEQESQEPGLQPPVTGLSASESTAERKDLPSASATAPTIDSVLVSPQVPSNQISPGEKPSKLEVPSTSTNMAQWVFTATAESWLELRSSNNSVIWSGVLNPGDTRRIETPLPVRVVVGRAQVVNATLRGQVFDLKPHTQATVARFEVKE